MALVIEDGSLVAGANAYVTVAEVRAFAGARASTVPAVGAPGDAEIEAAVIAATDYLEALRDRYKGTKVDGDQSLQFPRNNVYLDGFPVLATVIPALLKAAQCQLAIEVAAGLDLQPTGDGLPIKKEKVDVIETEYFSGSGAPQPIVTKARALLTPLFKDSGGLVTVRV
jgi:Putative DnaT-like ssDNA binding protein